MEMLPIIIKQRERGCVPDALHGLLSAGSQPSRNHREREASRWGHSYKTLYSTHLALKVCSKNRSSALNPSKRGKCHSLSLSKADS